MDLPVVELRRYTLVPGRRDEMIAIFERELMEGQEEAGMSLLGQFRDLDRPDHFVWLRGFPDMESRRESLTAFYSGPVWKEHARSVRPTMVDTDDVLLLRPAGPGTGFAPMPLPPPDAEPPGGLVVATVRTGPPAVPGTLATLVTEPAENTYPALPVRTDASVFVTFDRYGGIEEYEPGPAADGTHVARLTPTARSPLRT
jgi:NIPSNAP